MKKNRREIVLAVMVVLLLIVMGIKSVYLDPFKPATEEEQQWVTRMQSIIDEEHTNFMYDNHIMSTRIIAVKDEGGRFRGHYRKYIFWMFPFGDEYYDSLEAE